MWLVIPLTSSPTFLDHRRSLLFRFAMVFGVVAAVILTACVVMILKYPVAIIVSRDGLQNSLVCARSDTMAINHSLQPRRAAGSGHANIWDFD